MSWLARRCRCRIWNPPIEVLQAAAAGAGREYIPFAAAAGTAAVLSLLQGLRIAFQGMVSGCDTAFVHQVSGLPKDRICSLAKREPMSFSTI